ncbi:RNA polymerase factor sigma-54 [Sporosarcina sp. FA9]|uniref:RNA polymerase factor sigma-54 n=1 Tax=Sporosarcina sp. FA9 TaxID=3413030 RepID=UPI003F65ED73
MQLIIQQRQDLSLVMTSELRQAIELLQYSTYELYQYLIEQGLENPLIELEEIEDDSLYKANLNSNASTYGSIGLPLDYVESEKSGMRSNLLQQASFLFRGSEYQNLLKFIIYNLDDNGYLSLDNYDYNLTFNEQMIEKGIHLLQQVGPVGVGARNLKECLLLQITYEFPEEQLAKYLVENHLDLLANRKWDDISFQMSLPLSQVKAIYDFIKTLNPKPCSGISDFTTEYLNPDIIVEYKNDGLSYYLNDRYLPKVRLNSDYTSLLKGKNDTSKYLSKHYSSYQWLLSSIEQRRITITKIVMVILERQARFFKDGFISLQPLTLKEVADEIDMHESTVSRATANKIIQTPQGTFDLRMLFTSKLDTTNGDSISQTTMKALLQHYIAQENKHKPFSDQKIANYFNTDKGIKISRRTISKYREEMNIPSSRMRREIQI